MDKNCRNCKWWGKPGNSGCRFCEAYGSGMCCETASDMSCPRFAEKVVYPERKPVFHPGSETPDGAVLVYVSSGVGWLTARKRADEWFIDWNGDKVSCDVLYWCDLPEGWE